MSCFRLYDVVWLDFYMIAVFLQAWSVITSKPFSNAFQSRSESLRFQQ